MYTLVLYSFTRTTLEGALLFISTHPLHKRLIPTALTPSPPFTLVRVPAMNAGNKQKC